MIEDDETPEAPESVPDIKPRFTPLVIVSMLFGFLLCLASVGAYFSYQKSRGLEAEIVLAREEIKNRGVALEDMRSQIEALSSQIRVLKEFSVARSRGNGVGKVDPDDSLPTSSPASSGAMPLAPAHANDAAKKKNGGAVKADAVPVPAQEKRAKQDAQNCELVGKSPEEQAATLKRCVSAMDDVAGTPRSGSAAEKKR